MDTRSADPLFSPVLEINRRSLATAGFFRFLDSKALFLDQKLVPPLRGPSLTYKFSGDK